MKKSFALVLALTMVFGCLFSVAPMAEATDSTGSAVPAEKYVPEIAYSNVNYTEGLTLMFAVPAPASLDEGSSVKLLVWEESSSLYSYNESISSGTMVATATAIGAEANKSTIGGKEYLVFKYSGLTAEMMTDVIYARAVVVDANNKAISYGSVLDYSIVEYVQTAKGSFEGTPALSNAAVLDLLDAMVDFGALAQIAISYDEPYTPNGFFANDDLKKIWITPVVAGQVKDKVLGGFFKYEEDGFATVYAPHFDGVSITAYKDSTGAVLEDALMSSSAEAFGFQVEAINGDINLTVEYEPVALRGMNAEDFGADFAVNNQDVTTVQGDTTKLAELGAGWANANTYKYNKTMKSNFSGAACVADSYGRMNYYHGAKVVQDPSDPDNLVLLFTATGQPTIEFNDTKPADYTGFGYGDTVEDAITFEFEIGKPNADAVVSTGQFYFRNREATVPAGKFPLDNQGNQMSKDKHDTFLFKVTENVVHFYLNTGSGNTAANGDEICTLPDVGLARIAITVYSDGRIAAFVEDEKGVMVKTAEAQAVMSERFAIFNAQHQKNLADEDPSNDQDFAAFADFSSWFTMNTLNVYWNFGAGQHGTISNKQHTGDAAFLSESVMLGGVETPLLNADGSYNQAAIQVYAEENYSVLLDGFRLFGGAIYE